MSEADVITVKVDQPYDVVVGRGLLGDLVAGIPEDAFRAAVVHTPTLRVTAEVLQEALKDSGLETILIEVPDGEDAKTSDVAAFCWTALGQSGFTRTDVVIGVGGGAVTDLAGFVAATWLRGIRVIQVPTTLLAMVDAAVGGKTGINTAAGKNLVGSFHSPTLVLCDLATLSTLPQNDYVAGLAEVIKCGFIADPEILAIVEQDPMGVRTPDHQRTAELIRRSVQVKADVVAGDLREDVAGIGSRKISREVLNYGHTLGHAIERVERYRWRHGAAISVGMVFVAELARLAGRLSDKDAELHREVLGEVGLPTSYRADRWAELYEGMKMDKKTRGATLRFVVLDGIGRPSILSGPDPALLHAAYSEIAETL